MLALVEDIGADGADDLMDGLRREKRIFRLILRRFLQPMT